MKGDLRILTNCIEERLKEVKLPRGKISKEKLVALGYTIGVSDFLVVLLRRSPD